MERLDKHFEKLAQASFSRYGFAYGELLARWPAIVGDTLARHCEPERIRWPRGDGGNAQKGGGTLIVRVEAGWALDLQHQVHHMLERLNQFYGYAAIAGVKLVTSPSLSAKPLNNKPKALDAAVEQALEDELSKVSDDGLRAALGRLGRGALAGPRSSPQGK
jgi:hypothetical protein